MISGSDYYRRCLHKLYPDRVDGSGARILGSKHLPYLGVNLKVLLERLDPLELHITPGDEQVAVFVAWAREFRQRGVGGTDSAEGFVINRAAIAHMLKKLDADPAYRIALEPAPTIAETDLFERFRERLRARAGTLGPRRKTMVHDVQVFLGQLGRLRHMSGRCEYEDCGDVTLAAAAEYCNYLSVFISG